MDLSVFEAKALAHALTEHGHSVSERTVQRWKAGVTRPKPQDIAAIRRLLGTTKDAPAGAEASIPAWAEGLADDAAEKAVRRLVPPELLGAAHRLLADLAGLEPPSVEADDATRVARDPVE